MDTALNLAVVTEALGRHTTSLLPSPEELTGLIAQVEIDAFRARNEVGESLLLSAWYLHGVASAPEASGLYSADRQRRAYAVSAHIFDLALNDETGSDHSRLTLCFAAQVGYRQAALDPNATAVYRRVQALLSTAEPLGESVDTMALQVGVAFLGLEFGRLSPLLAQSRRQLNDLLADANLVTLSGTMFGPAQAVVIAVSSLLSYLRNGDSQQLENARATLNSVILGTAGQGDHDAKWVAAHLLSVADGMATSSVWSVLPPSLPPEAAASVARAFTYGAPPVLTLWPPQVELLTRDRRNPLDISSNRLLLSVPTSAGKTLLAQVIICAHLTQTDGDVCFVTPLRSLGREVRQSLGRRVRMLNRRVGPELPDFADFFEALLSGQGASSRGDVEIMTPERLMQLMRRDPAATLDRFSLFVIDEAQMLADPGRGLLLEGLLSLLAVTPVRMVLLSGVLGNATTFASWLAPDDDVADVLYTSDWRGPRRMNGLLYSEPVWDLATQRATRSARFHTRETVPTVAKVLVRPAEGQTFALRSDPDEPIGQLVLNVPATGPKERNAAASTANYVFDATAAQLFMHAGSLLMIVTHRATAKNAAGVLARNREVDPGTAELADFLIERLGVEHPLVDYVRRGIGYHHAGLPDDVLEALEDALRADELSALVATSTLAEGVNLPVRTVLVSETKYDGQAAGQQLNPARLLNAIGRAGRAGRESEGWIVLALHKQDQAQDFRVFEPSSEDLAANSTLLAEEALASLAEAETLIASTADAILRLPVGPAASFASHVWMVLSTLEQLAEIPDAPDLTAAIQRMLAFQQMQPELRHRWAALMEKVDETFSRTPPDQRRRWALAGTSLGSASSIDDLSRNLAARLIQHYGVIVDPFTEAEALTVETTIDQLIDAETLTNLLALPEGEKTWVFRATTNSPPFEVPIREGILGWVQGLEMTELSDALLPASIGRPRRLELMVDAVSQTFEHYLSWTLGILVEQVNDHLRDASASCRLPEHLSPAIRYGVDTTQAVALLTTGMRSRRLAHRLGRFASSRELDLEGLKQSLAPMHISGWRDEFDTRPREIAELLELVRPGQGSLLQALLQDGSITVEMAALPSADQGVDSFGLAPPPPPSTVQLRYASDSSEIEVVEKSAVVGLLAATAHADVADIIAAGVDTLATRDGIVLNLTRVDS